MEEKKCKKCGELLPISQFSSRKNSQDGYSHMCKRCIAESRRQGILLRKSKTASVLPEAERPLSKYTPRQLMEKLRLRGYDGELTYIQKIRLSAL